MFKNIFGKNSEKKKPKETKTSKMNWTPLTSVEQLNDVKEASKYGYVALFKHSTRCVISRTVLQRFENDYPLDTNLKLYYIDLLNYREVSNAITDAFQVIHQSPQFIIIKDEKVVTSASHDGINGLDIANIVK